MYRIYSKKLNILILLWIFTLVFTSGYTNCLTILYCNVPITHFTGNITNLAINILKGKIENIYTIIPALISFFIGGTFSGFIFFKKHIGFSNVFGISLLFCAFIYILFNIIFKNNLLLIISTGFLSGMQNALLTRYKGITTRTTHITGYLTDCSVNLGRAMRGDKNAFDHFLFFLINIFIFFLGGIIGFLCLEKFGFYSFFIIGLLTAFSGFFYTKFLNFKDYNQIILKNK